MKPMVGMTFDTLIGVEKFYKSYAHDAGFSVHVGQHNKQNEEIIFMRYYCSRERYRQESQKKILMNPRKKEVIKYDGNQMWL